MLHGDLTPSGACPAAPELVLLSFLIPQGGKVWGAPGGLGAAPRWAGQWGPELVPHLGSSCGGSSAVELGMCQTPEFGVMEAELCLQMELLAQPLGAGKGVE